MATRKKRGDWLGWLAVGVTLLSCGVRLSAVGREVKDGGEVTPWGAWAAQLPVSPCPVAPALVVDTTAEELESGTTIADRAEAGVHLSLTEALWIAKNRAGPTTINFDPAVFPVDAPATIVLNGAFTMPQGQRVTAGAQVAGCRYFSEPDELMRSGATQRLRPMNAEIGPGAVVLGPVGGLGWSLATSGVASKSYVVGTLTDSSTNPATSTFSAPFQVP